MSLRYIVDTSVISELMKPEPSKQVIDWFWENEGSIYLNAITAKELCFGIMRLSESKRKRTLLKSTEGILADSVEKILPFDGFCACLCAEMQEASIKQGKRPHIENLMIASIAKKNDAVLVTRNVKNFEHLGIELINPFD